MLPLCKFCGSQLVLLDVQRRAADEGQELIELCRTCMLDMGRCINACTDRVVPLAPISVKHPYRVQASARPLRPLSKVVDVTHMPSDTEIELSCGGEMAKHDYDCMIATLAGNVTHSITESRGVSFVRSVAISLHGLSHSAVYRRRDCDNGTTSSTIKLVRIKATVAPNMIFKESLEWLVEPSIVDTCMDVVVGTYHSITDTSNPAVHITAVNYVVGGYTHYSLEVELTDPSTYKGDYMLEYFYDILSLCGYLSKLSIPSSVYSAVRPMCARAYDSLVPVGDDSDNYSYVAKVDGERCLLVKVGSMWVLCSFYKSMMVVGYFPAMRATDCSSVTWIVDVEVTMDGIIVAIDVLVDGTGTIAMSDRTLDNNILMDMLTVQVEIPRLYIRDYFDTFDECSMQLEELPFPCDGVLAMFRTGVTCLKLKSAKSIELQYRLDTSNNDMAELVTADQHVMYKVHSGAFNDGDIVELRLMVDVDAETVQIVHVVWRPDKLKANLIEAVSKVMRSNSTSLHMQMAQRYVITTKCFALRTAIYSMTEHCSIMPHVLLDVGTGRGQSMDVMRDRSKYSSCIMLEPDKKALEQLVARYPFVTAYFIGDDVDKVLSNVGTSRGFFMALCMTLEQFWTLPLGRMVIERHVGAITCVFAINFVVELVREINIVTGVPVLGCCYMYDSANSDGVLVDSFGIVMRIVDKVNGVVTVTWDGDKYAEPVLTTSMLSAHGCSLQFTQCFVQGEVVQQIDCVYSASMTPHVASALCNQPDIRNS